MRVSSGQIYENFDFYNKLRNEQLQQNSNKLSSQRRHQSIGEAPMASAHSSYNLSRMQRYLKYDDNAGYALGRYGLSESRLSQVIENLQSMRELAVQAANSTNTGDDLAQVGRVVNELLEDTLMLANSRDEQGDALFAGNAVKGEAFASLRRYLPQLGREALAEVSYQGDLEQRQLELEDGIYLPVSFSGQRLFWAEQDEIVGGLPVDNFRSLEQQSFFIDGQEIKVDEGDNIASIVRKINSAELAVRAQQDPITQVLMLRSSVPHQIQLQQPQGSVLLQELGLLAAGGTRLQDGLHPDALRSDGSLFSVLIDLRDAMLEGDVSSIGGRELARLDQTISTLTSGRTDLGARQQRLEQQQLYSQQALLDYREMETRESDLDAAEAVSELQRLMTTQQAIYQSVSRLANLNLMNFLTR